jgi:hypothetical protein
MKASKVKIWLLRATWAVRHRSMKETQILNLLRYESCFYCITISDSKPLELVSPMCEHVELESSVSQNAESKEVLGGLNMFVGTKCSKERQNCPIHAIKARRGVEVQLHSFSTSTLDRGEWSMSYSSRFTLNIHWIGGLVDTRTGLNVYGAEKISSNRIWTLTRPARSLITIQTTLPRALKCVAN